MFKYGGIRLFLVKVLFGLIFLIAGIFTISSLGSHNLNDPGLGKLINNENAKNVFGYFGALTSSIFLFVFGLYSYVIGLFLFMIGFKLTLGLIIKKIFLKFVLIVISSIFFNHLVYKIVYVNTDSGIIYTAINKLLIDLVQNYNQTVINLKILEFVLFFICLILLIFSFCYSFGLKYKHIKKVKLFKFIASICYFLFFRPFYLIVLKLTKIRITKKAPKQKTKNEPLLFRNNSQKIINKKTNDGNKKYYESEVDEYFYKLPSTDIFSRSLIKQSHTKEVQKLNQKLSEKLEKTLLEYGVEGRIINFKSGPIVTLFEFVPKAGVKASKIVGLSDDIARAMSSLSARISSQPGKTSLGIEIPNVKREGVFFGDLVSDNYFLENNQSLRLALGKDISGEVVFTDLEKMPHLLIAGTTGSGKSVGINSMIMSLIVKFKPNECKLILIDPKMLELSIYEDIPHLLTPVVTNPNKAVYALKWVVREMENRYKLMSTLNVKNIKTFNDKINNFLTSGKKIFREVQTGIDKDTRKPIIEKREIPLEEMPFIVVVIDEMADLMMVAGKEVEGLVQRLAQMARASGIHLITATQRPSVDVITGTIKANFPSRISYKVASKFDSRTIINEMGAEQLLGSGDMLFLENGANLKRLHGGFISEQEIEKVVNFIKKQNVFDFKNEISLEDNNGDGSLSLNFNSGDVDELYTRAVDIVINQQKVSTSFIQRYLQIGYNRAARIVEKMEEDGIVSEASNAGKRHVLKKTKS
tara:strand:- start:26949 stop:29213 length:2265 start_codon:yes stop_codon:yes gene_type:complete